MTHLLVCISYSDTTGMHPAACRMSGHLWKDFGISQYFGTWSHIVGYSLYLDTTSDDTTCLSFLPICLYDILPYALHYHLSRLVSHDIPTHFWYPSVLFCITWPNLKLIHNRKWQMSLLQLNIWQRPSTLSILSKTKRTCSLAVDYMMLFLTVGTLKVELQILQLCRKCRGDSM